MTRRITRARAFLSADVILALAVIMILTAAMAVATTKQPRASQRLAETRAAARLAEATMIALQTAQKPPAPPAEAVVTVKPIDAPTGLPANCAWATVTVTHKGRTCELTGIVRADALKGATR